MITHQLSVWYCAKCSPQLDGCVIGTGIVRCRPADNICKAGSQYIHHRQDSVWAQGTYRRTPWTSAKTGVCVSSICICFTKSAGRVMFTVFMLVMPRHRSLHSRAWWVDAYIVEIKCSSWPSLGQACCLAFVYVLWLLHHSLDWMSIFGRLLLLHLRASATKLVLRLLLWSHGITCVLVPWLCQTAAITLHVKQINCFCGLLQVIMFFVCAVFLAIRGATGCAAIYLPMQYEKYWAQDK